MFKKWMHGRKWLYIGNSFKNSWPVPSDYNLFGYRFRDTTSIKMEYNLLSK